MTRIVKSEVFAKEPNSKIPHLALSLGLGSGDHRAMPLR